MCTHPDGNAVTRKRTARRADGMAEEKEVEEAEENGGERRSEGFREDVKYGVTITAVVDV